MKATVGSRTTGNDLPAWIDPFILWNTSAEPGDDRIPLGTLRTLSRLLDLDLEELVSGPTTPPQTPGDDIRIEAALAEPPGSFTRDDLAGALEWTLYQILYGWNRQAFRLADERASLDTLATPRPHQHRPRPPGTLSRRSLQPPPRRR